jgi:hypothetical protein
MSSAHASLDDALDALDEGGGTVEVDRDAGTAEVDVIDVDRLGVRVRRVKVTRDADVDVAAEADALPDRLRSLPDRVEPHEVSPELGGAILRTPEDDVRDNKFFEVDVRPRHTTIGRTEVGADGERRPADFTLSREQLDRLIDEAAG